MDGPRILVLGTSGSGKSTVARLAAARLGVRHVELDAIRHQRDWTELPDEEFRGIVGEVVIENRWVIDGNYAIVRDLAVARATRVVWLDLPRPLVMAQVVWRSLTRAVTRRELWNGNRERFSAWLDSDHPIRWAWDTHAPRRAEFASQMDDKWVRLRSRSDVRRWLDRLRP